MQHFLQAANDQNILINKFYYNINLLKTNSLIFQCLGIRFDIFDNTTDLWKTV